MSCWSVGVLVEGFGGWKWVAVIPCMVMVFHGIVGKTDYQSSDPMTGGTLGR